MTKKITALLLAALMTAALISGCGEDKGNTGKATADEPAVTTSLPVSRQTTTSAAEGSTAETEDKSQPETTNAAGSASPSTHPTTAKPVQDNIPPDDITSGNINPNLGQIQQRVIDEINSLAVREISLDQSEVLLVEGEEAKLNVSFEPSNAADKTISLSFDKSVIEATEKNKTVTVKARAAGESTLTVTGTGGVKAECKITVIPEIITDDTVLPHSLLMNSENAQRWKSEIIAAGENFGMTCNPLLSGSSFVMKTSAETGSNSYNGFADLMVNKAKRQFSAYAGAAFGDYAFNVTIEPDGGEFNFAVTVSKNAVPTEVQSDTEPEAEE